MAYDPFFGTNPVVSSMEEQRGRLEATRENSARLASSFNWTITKGSGELNYPNVVRFDCTFVQRPIVAYGAWVQTDLQPGTGFPVPRGGVYRWERDTNGFYVGAWVYMTVDAASEDYVVEHDFTFTGIAMKDLSDSLLDMLDVAAPAPQYFPPYVEGEG